MLFCVKVCDVKTCMNSVCRVIRFSCIRVSGTWNAGMMLSAVFVSFVLWLSIKIKRSQKE